MSFGHDQISRRAFNKMVGASAGATLLGGRPALAAARQRFDVHVPDLLRQGVPVIRPWKTVVIDRDYVGPWISTGDVDGDGEKEIICARVHKSGNERYTSAAVAHKLDGSVLWHWGDPRVGGRPLSHDVGFQVYDWDNQGRTDVVVAAEGKLVQIDGATGEVKRELRIPKNASDCVAFANLTGGDHARDVIVKTRYEEIWALDYKGNELWHTRLPNGCRTAHQARPMDIDGDGRDEVVVGYAMLDADGKPFWSLDTAKYHLGANGHLDCARVLRHAEALEDVRIVLTCCGDNRILVVDGAGKVVWTDAGVHFQSVDVGRFVPDVPGKQIVVDISVRPEGRNPVRVYDERGNRLGQFTMNHNRHHNLVDWFGDDMESLLLHQEHALVDGEGNLQAVFENPPPAGTNIPPAEKARTIARLDDFTGNGALDIVMGFNPSPYVHVFRNEKGKAASADAVARWERNITLY